MKCPHAKDGRPCYLKEGITALVTNRVDATIRICKGCNRGKQLLDIERTKLRRGGNDTCR